MFVRLWPVASFLLIIITNNQAKWLLRSSLQSSSASVSGQDCGEKEGEGKGERTGVGCRGGEGGTVVVSTVLPAMYFCLAVMGAQAS